MADGGFYDTAKGAAALNAHLAGVGPFDLPCGCRKSPKGERLCSYHEGYEDGYEAGLAAAHNDGDQRW